MLSAPFGFGDWLAVALLPLDVGAFVPLLDGELAVGVPLEPEPGELGELGELGLVGLVVVPLVNVSLYAAAALPLTH